MTYKDSNPDRDGANRPCREFYLFNFLIQFVKPLEICQNFILY